jgi:hypothetical protein
MASEIVTDVLICVLALTGSFTQWAIMLRGLPAWTAASYLLFDLKGYSLAQPHSRERADDIAQIESFLVAWLAVHRQQESGLPRL